MPYVTAVSDAVHGVLCWRQLEHHRSEIAGLHEIVSAAHVPSDDYLRAEPVPAATGKHLSVGTQIRCKMSQQNLRSRLMASERDG